LIVPSTVPPASILTAGENATAVIPNRGNPSLSSPRPDIASESARPESGLAVASRCPSDDNAKPPWISPFFSDQRPDVLSGRNVKEARRPIGRGAGQYASVRREDHAVGLPDTPEPERFPLHRRHVPERDAVIESTGREQSTVGRKRDASNALGTDKKRASTTPGSHIPQSDGPIIIHSGQVRAIGRECQAVYDHSLGP
jgi:hypothetical protein